MAFSVLIPATSPNETSDHVVGHIGRLGKKPANVLSEALARPAMESSILFSFETDFAGG